MIALPPELINEILGFSWQDRRTLARCSLVSRQWCQLSSPYLFYTLQLRDAPPSYPEKPLDALHRFLQDHPRIRGLVRELKLSPVDGIWEVQISLNHIHTLISLLPALHTLIVGSVRLVERSDKLGDDDHTRQDELCPLRLRHVSLSSSFCFGIHPTFLSRFFSLFSQIDELHLQGGVMPRIHDASRYLLLRLYEPQAAPHSARPVVRALTLGRFDASQRLLPALPVFVRVDTLETLRITHFPGVLVAMVDALLCQTPHLRELELFFYRFASSNLAYALAQSEQYHLPSLAHCPQLEVLKFGTEIHLDYDLSDINNVYWRRCVEALSSACTEVRSVAVSIQTWAVTGTNYFEPLAELDWGLLDQLLSRFPDLTTVNMDISSRNVGRWILSEDEMREGLGEQFSLRNRSMLHISFSDTPSTH